MILATGLAQPAGAGEKLRPFSLECESLEGLESRIGSCNENTEAVDSAKECYGQLMKAWKEAPADLNRVFAFNKKNKDRKQEESLADAQADYKRSIAKLDNLIAVTNRNTDLVASYPLVMHEDPETEVDCYTDAFKEVQRIVDALDDRLVEGEAARAGSDQLRNVAHASDGHIDSVAGEKLRKSNVGPVAAAPNTGKPRNRDSDVTGLNEEKAKNNNLKAPGVDIKKMKNESNSAWVDSFLESYPTK